MKNILKALVLIVGFVSIGLYLFYSFVLVTNCGFGWSGFECNRLLPFVAIVSIIGIFGGFKYWLNSSKKNLIIFLILVLLPIVFAFSYYQSSEHVQMKYFEGRNTMVSCESGEHYYFKHKIPKSSSSCQDAVTICEQYTSDSAKMSCFEKENYTFTDHGECEVFTEPWYSTEIGYYKLECHIDVLRQTQEYKFCLNINDSQASTKCIVDSIVKDSDTFDLSDERDSLDVYSGVALCNQFSGLERDACLLDTVYEYSSSYANGKELSSFACVYIVTDWIRNSCESL